MFTNLIMLLFTGHTNAYEQKLHNQIDRFNELTICFVTIHMIFFTKWNENTLNQQRYGYSMLFFVYSSTLINLYFVLKAITRVIYLIYIKYKFRMKYYIK